MVDPKGALDKLEVVVRQQTVKKVVPLKFIYQPYRSTANTAVYVASIKGRASELVREAIIPGETQYQRIQYTTANAYCRLEGTFDQGAFQEDTSNLVFQSFGLQSRLLLTSGGITGPADPVGFNIPQNFFWQPAGAAVRTNFDLDVRGATAAGGKVGDEAVPEIQVVIQTNLVDSNQPFPTRLTLPGFKATLVVTITSPIHL
jgi:hypothetical protein